MSVCFNVKNQVTVVPCYSQLNLLAHAQMEELDIGSRCGGHGLCGGDKVLIQSDLSELSPVTEREKEFLTASEIAQGWRLGCQCWPVQDGGEIAILLKAANRD